MNNNRNNNNNRRGRGRNNRNQSGNPNQQNRIDSRARGNAPQLLDKYKKLAQDAQHNGDRVQAEYYLQFADHYFRVIADNKARQEEARAKRQDERGDDDEYGDDDGEDDSRRSSHRNRGRRDEEGESGSGEQDQSRARKANGRSRRDRDYDGQSEQGPIGAEGEAISGDDFARETKPKRKPRMKKPDMDSGEIDVSTLPPAIGAALDDEAPKAKRAPRRRKASETADTAAAEA